MKMIPKATWSAVILGAIAGCTSDEEAAAPAAGPTAPVVSKPAPSAGPAADAPASGGMSAETKGPAAAVPAKTADEAPKVEGPKAEADKSSGATAKLTAGELAAIKELPAAEQASAEKQLLCPVSAHHLGSMGKPLKVTAEGRTFYLCCDSCEDKVKSDPKAVVAKLDKQSGQK
jgi:YHS domain-containing protein